MEIKKLEQEQNSLGAIRFYPKNQITNFNVEPKLSTSYDIFSYGNNVVKRSLNVFDNQDYNNQHMIMGLTSEITDEYLTALFKDDVPNIVEELGDAYWFGVGLLIVNGYFDNPIYKEKIENVDVFLLNYGFSWSDADKAKSFQDNPEELKALYRSVYDDTLKAVGKLNTIFKNLLIKNSPKYDGKVLTEEEIVDSICNFLICLNTLAIFSSEKIFTIREVNDKKLFKRYDGGTFTAEKSLNRDVEKERQIIEDNLK